jgi:hypothetical protein
LIAEQENRFALVVFFCHFKFMLWKDLLIRLSPDPFDLFF